jgi:hypothetical protein
MNMAKVRRIRKRIRYLSHRKSEMAKVVPPEGCGKYAEKVRFRWRNPGWRGLPNLSVAVDGEN